MTEVYTTCMHPFGYLKTINILDIRSIINVAGDTRRLQNYHFLLYLTGTHTHEKFYLSSEIKHMFYIL